MSRRVRGPTKKTSFWDYFSESSLFSMCGGRFCEGQRFVFIFFCFIYRNNPPKPEGFSEKEEDPIKKNASPEVSTSKPNRRSMTNRVSQAKRRPDSDDDDLNQKGDEDTDSSNAPPSKSSPRKRKSSKQLSDAEALREKIRDQYRKLDESTEGWLYKANSHGIGRKKRWVNVWRSALLYSEKPGGPILGGIDLSVGAWEIQLDVKDVGKFMVQGSDKSMEFEVSKGESTTDRNGWKETIENQINANILIKQYLTGGRVKGVIKDSDSKFLEGIREKQAIEMFDVPISLLK